MTRVREERIIMLKEVSGSICEEAYEKTKIMKQECKKHAKRKTKWQRALRAFFCMLPLNICFVFIALCTGAHRAPKLTFLSLGAPAQL